MLAYKSNPEFFFSNQSGYYILIIEEFSRAIEQLLGRAGGPLHIRLLIQPAIAITIAIRAGLQDARENKPPFLWYFVKNTAERKKLIRAAWKDIGRLLVVAFIIDSLYQLFVLKTFYLFQALIVTCVLALLPYVILRGIITRLQRRFSQS